MSDVFSAIAEGRRRDILAFLAPAERSVNEIVHALKLPQPSVSKHLRVLREVGLVDVRRAGRQMHYRVNLDSIRPLQEFTGVFVRYWGRQLARVQERAERKAGADADRKPKTGGAT